MTNKKDLEITSDEFHQKIKSGKIPLLLDVRGSQKFADWNIFNSKNIPIMQLLAKKEFPSEFYENELLIICGKGKDSFKGAEHLKNYGINAKSLQGGLNAWNEAFDSIEVISEGDLKLFQLRRMAKGCLSYILYNNGEAIVIDPAHNINPYLKFAEDKTLSITHILDTHLHADHVSGARELEKETGAEYYVNPNDPYEFEHEPITHGLKFSIKNEIVLEAKSTPGHTPGSTSFIMKNLGVMTGDILFIDGIGRPDLADKTAEFAKDLYHTLTSQLSKLPSNMFYAPAHHGKFQLEHLEDPLISDIETFGKDEILRKNEEEFIKFAIRKSQETKQPPSFQTIRQINSGNVTLTPLKINELEIGPNRCAIG
jgi:glyoxylase-like metal-dependent hydrolase (beta-lactamase superfamily II)